MPCNTCLKLNPIPGCIDSDEFLLTGITFPDHTDQTLNGIFQDMATGRVSTFDVPVDVSGIPSIDIAALYNLDKHVYELRFMDQDGVTANFLLTNPNSTTEEGCCLELSIVPNITASDEWVLSSQTCIV